LASEVKRNGRKQASERHYLACLGVDMRHLH